MNKDTHELLGFLKGLQHVINHCDKILLVEEKREYYKEYEQKVDKQTLDYIMKFCSEQIKTYKCLVQTEKQ